VEARGDMARGDMARGDIVTGYRRISILSYQLSTTYN
jgi:hypothetical protein